MPEELVGQVTDFFARPVVAGIALTGLLKVGETIHIKGSSNDMELVVSSMQIDRVDVKEAGAGKIVGIKVPDRVRRGDKVYRVIP